MTHPDSQSPVPPQAHPAPQQHSPQQHRAPAPGGPSPYGPQPGQFPVPAPQGRHLQQNTAGQQGGYASHQGGPDTPGRYAPHPGAPVPHGGYGTQPGMPIIMTAPKSAGIAVLLSFLWLGAGHLYANRIGVGIALIVYEFLLFLLSITFVGLIISVPLWIISLPIVMILAANAANEYNRRNGLVVR